MKLYALRAEGMEKCLQRPVGESSDQEVRAAARPASRSRNRLGIGLQHLPLKPDPIPGTGDY